MDKLKCVKIARIVKFCLDFPYFLPKIRKFWQSPYGLKPATHLAILYADRGEFDRTHLAIFFADRGDVAVSKSHCDKIAQPDGLTLLAIRSDERRKSREGHTWRMPANLIVDI